MASIINVRLNDARVLPVSFENLDLKLGDKVIVQIDDFLEFGTVLHPIKAEVEPVGKVVRIATPQDISQNEQNLSFREQDKTKVLERVTLAGLEMKLVAVLRSFDNKKILIMYTADDRVDFRNLVRDLAGIFKMRVEMRQISERDEARFVGGCGMCGQEVCCRRFLGQPRQTSIKMAKIQGQALTPNKINGLCGKLMCCLQYEYSQYKEILDNMPVIDSRVKTPKGEGAVVYNDCINELVAVRLDNAEELSKFKMEELEILSVPETEDE